MARNEAEARLQETAKRLLGDAGFLEVLKELKNESIVLWADTSSAAIDRREEIWRDLQAVGRIENRLKALRDGAILDARKEVAAKRT